MTFTPLDVVYLESETLSSAPDDGVPSPQSLIRSNDSLVQLRRDGPLVDPLSLVRWIRG